VCQWIVNLWKPDPADVMMTWLRGPQQISWLGAATGAFLGTFSHVLLDSMVHADVQPWAPFSESNVLLGTIDFGALQLLCIGVGVLGCIGLMIVFMVDAER
jgi:membrane-bound metal-dependent hydrolase YbcI (DUF457 family)